MNPNKYTGLAFLIVALSGCSPNDSPAWESYTDAEATSAIETSDDEGSEATSDEPDDEAPLEPEPEPEPAPAVCGNGVREADEQCDGEDLGAQTCDSIGWPLTFPDALACRVDCKVDSSACSHECERHANCQDPKPYCVAGTCEDGREGTRCADAYDCKVAFCTTNYDPEDGWARCYDGSYGDPCEAPYDCSEWAPFCVDNACETGTFGSVCKSDADCISSECRASTCE